MTLVEPGTQAPWIAHVHDQWETGPNREAPPTLMSHVWRARRDDGKMFGSSQSQGKVRSGARPRDMELVPSPGPIRSQDSAHRIGGATHLIAVQCLRPAIRCSPAVQAVGGRLHAGAGAMQGLICSVHDVLKALRH